MVGERRGADGGEYADGAVVERGDGADTGAVMGVRDEELGRVGRQELAAERAEALRGEQRAGGGVRRPSEPTVKLAICEVLTSATDETGAVAVEQDVAGLRVVRERDGRAGDRPRGGRRR